jgi:hypothetical protein
MAMISGMVSFHQNLGEQAGANRDVNIRKYRSRFIAARAVAPAAPSGEKIQRASPDAVLNRNAPTKTSPPGPDLSREPGRPRSLKAEPTAARDAAGAESIGSGAARPARPSSVCERRFGR